MQGNDFVKHGRQKIWYELNHHTVINLSAILIKTPSASGYADDDANMYNEG